MGTENTNKVRVIVSQGDKEGRPVFTRSEKWMFLDW